LRDAVADRLHVESPFGLADLFALRVVPNPYRKTVGFDRAFADVRRAGPKSSLITSQGRNREVGVAAA
jgi:hypothetical protein